MSQANTKKNNSEPSNIVKPEVLAKTSPWRPVKEEVYKVLLRSVCKNRGIDPRNKVPKFTNLEGQNQLRGAGYDNISQGAILNYDNRSLFLYCLRDTDSVKWLEEEAFREALGDHEATKFKG